MACTQVDHFMGHQQFAGGNNARLWSSSEKPAREKSPAARSVPQLCPLKAVMRSLQPPDELYTM